LRPDSPTNVGERLKASDSPGLLPAWRGGVGRMADGGVTVPLPACGRTAPPMWGRDLKPRSPQVSSPLGGEVSAEWPTVGLRSPSRPAAGLPHQCGGET